MREDYVTNTEHDAGLYEQRRGQGGFPDDRPTRAEAERDMADDYDSTYGDGPQEPPREPEPEPEPDELDDDLDWNVATSEHLSARPGEQ